MPDLLGQLPEETVQSFAADALAEDWELTLRQPRMVNALAYEAFFEGKAARLRTHASQPRPGPISPLLDAKVSKAGRSRTKRSWRTKRGVRAWRSRWSEGLG